MTFQSIETFSLIAALITSICDISGRQIIFVNIFFTNLKKMKIFDITHYNT